MQLSKIGVISHPRIEIELVSMVTEKLTQLGVDLFFDPVTAEKIGREETKITDMKTDLALVFGGDGTILWVADEISGEPLILGVNTGKVGYLAELAPEDVMEKLDLLIKGDFRIDERMKLKVNDKFEALNEVLISSKEPATLLDFRITLDDREIAHFRADGVMVSTPTGSTGYSMSAGGSILHPELKGYIITPINPFLRRQFPIVVPEDSKTKIELIREDRKAGLIIDGRFIEDINPRQKTAVKKAEHKARFVRFSDDCNYNSLTMGKLR